jgi:hypothetical protein
MPFISFSNYLFESEQLTPGQKGKFESKYGWFDYYYEISDEYPSGVVVGLGAYVYKEYRGQGKYKEMLKELLTSVPLGTIVQFAVANKHLVVMFKKLGFKKVKRVAYWGEAQHTMEAVITPKLIDSI